MKLAKADEEWTAIDADIQEERCKCAYNKIFALLYIMNSDQTKYCLLLSGLSTQFALKQDQNPKSISHGTSILSDHKFDESYLQRSRSTKRKRKKRSRNQRIIS
jgi:hypothetical protein